MARPNSRWMPLDWGDYWRDTAHLTGCEHGGYLNLLGAYWTAGAALSDDDDRLRRLSRLSSKEWKAARQVISEFFEIRDGFWFQKRMEIELTRAQEIYDTRVARINKINELKSRPSSQESLRPSGTISSTVSSPPSPSPSPQPLPLKKERKNHRAEVGSDFDRWFDAYDWPGQPAKARRVWNAAVTKSKARGGIEFLIACAKLERQRWGDRSQEFRTHPHTWLRDGIWVDIPDRDLPESPTDRATNFYRHWKKTGKWLDDENQLDAVPQAIRDVVDGTEDRQTLEDQGQRRLEI